MSNYNQRNNNRYIYEYDYGKPNNNNPLHRDSNNPLYRDNQLYRDNSSI